MADSLSARIKGGTCGLGAIPADYYPLVVFPVLSKSGVKANLEIIKRRYYLRKMIDKTLILTYILLCNR